MPVYIGDDRTDEDAFKVLRKRGQGLGILVSKCPKDTNASYSLQDPTEVNPAQTRTCPNILPFCTYTHEHSTYRIYKTFLTRFCR
jgi:hypothetical protein